MPGVRHNKYAIVLFGLALVYLFTPFVAGLIGTHDRRGPKIFFQDHHELLYRIGYSFTHDEKPRVPFQQERPWFYGIPEKPYSK